MNDAIRILLVLVLLSVPATAQDGAVPASFAKPLTSFLSRYCYDCHGDGASEGGLALEQLGDDLADPATFAKWERIFDRVRQREMPPADADQPSDVHRETFRRLLGSPLFQAHAKSKATVLRRLNRREYEFTMNDLFGTQLNLAEMLPEDARSHEFDTVGAALGLSMVHLQKYIEAAGAVFDAAIAQTTEASQPKLTEASYADTREAERFVGRVWKKLDDGAVVRFSSGGYPTGMIRGSGVRQRGRYRIRVTGYAYQSPRPITFSVGGTSFARGSEKPIYGFYSFPPGKPASIELETWIDRNYMVQIEPYGIADPQRYQRKSIEDYDGPGLAIQKVTVEGPLLDEFPSRGHRLVFDGIQRREIPPRNPADRKKSWYKPQFEVTSDDETGDATRSLERVAAAAFRRPVTAAEVKPFTALFQREREAGESFEQALRTAVVAVFCSPKFLYLQETPGRLKDHALAARLSYFLTRTQPDEALSRAAAAGTLAADGHVLRVHTERLLEDPRFERFLRDFTDSWLNLREMDFTVPDTQLFPEFDPYLRYSMPLETRAFIKQLVKANLPVTNLVKSDFAMINSRLAELYELPEVKGAEIRKVPLPADSLRGGLLTQGSTLKVSANGTNTSPVTRGAWVMERILGQPPPPPPPGVSGVEPDIRGAATLRELLDKHRNLDACSACHRKIDPPGFALESFNPIGGYRERYRSIGNGDRVDKELLGRRVRYRLGLPVDSSGELPNGRSFANIQQFRDHLAEDSDQLARTLISKLLTFATGRELGFSDRVEVDRIVQATAADGHRVRDLLHAAVQSEIFRNK